MPFDCTDIKATLSGLIDDQVDAETRHLAERHISECAACRALVSQAEALDDLIAMDAAALVPGRLPDGFIDGVLHRTVHAPAHTHTPWSWTNWLGWVAAAACLGLAMSIWVLDRRLPTEVARFDAAKDPRLGLDQRTTPHVDTIGQRSWVYEGSLEPGTISRASLDRSVPIGSDFQLDDATSKAIDEQLALAQPARSDARLSAPRTVIAPADSDTLHAAAVLLDMLADSDLSDFADVERVREIAVYDELPQRLADVRSRLRPADRAAVMAAEAIILRIVNGPMDMGDLRLLHDTANSMNLASQVGAIGAGRDIATSL